MDGMTSTAVLHRLVISTSSVPAALALYEGVLGLAPARVAEGFAWLRTSDGLEVMLHERPATPSDTAVAPAFAVDELEATVDAWVRAGGAVVDPPEVQPWGERMAVLRDADGHLVCLVGRS
jgi:predicted enzyme related to lactoylglutathione lyase